MSVNGFPNIPELNLGASALSPFTAPVPTTTLAVSRAAETTEQVTTPILSHLTTQAEEQGAPPLVTLTAKAKMRFLDLAKRQDASDRIRLVALLRLALNNGQPGEVYVQELFSRNLMTAEDLLKEFSSVPMKAF